MFNWIDILFIATAILLVINGFRNGAVVSLINLITIPLGFVVAFVFGLAFTQFLASIGLGVTLLIAYIILFFATVFVVHLIATVIRGVLHKIPVIGFGDELVGAVIGFVEAWLLWVILLVAVGSFLAGIQDALAKVAQVGIRVDQFRAWHDVYNDAVSHSLFAQVNSFIVKPLPALQALLLKWR